MGHVTSTDKGAEATLKRYSELHHNGIRVGLIGPDAQVQHSDTTLTIEEIGTIHEFGLGVPERSFIRAYYDENKVRVSKLVKRTTELVAQGKMTKEKAFNALGLQLVADMQARIAKNIPPPLAASTIERKGSDIALIDSGQLRGAITYILELATK